MKVLPWVGGLRVGYKRMRPGTHRPRATSAQRQRIVAECRGLMDEGFDGIHVNVEPVDDGNVEFLALLRALRTAVGPDRMLSISAIRPGPAAPALRAQLPLDARLLRARGRAGRPDRGHGLRHRACPRRRSTGATSPTSRSTVTSRLAASHARARVLVGMPTYDETGLMHRAGVETPENALLGVVAGLRGLGAGGTFEGVALYAEWTTDDGVGDLRAPLARPDRQRSGTRDR